jgi:hypothetical protein
VSLARIAALNKKKHNLEIGANFADQACVLFQANKSDPNWGCTDAKKEIVKSMRIAKIEKDAVGSCRTGDASSLMDGFAHTEIRIDSDKNFSEREEVLSQLSWSTVKAFKEKLKQDREKLRTLGAKGGVSNFFGSLDIKVNICMSTSGVWTREGKKNGFFGRGKREGSEIRSMCEKLLACYPDRPRPGQDGKLENNSCEMALDRDDYLARLKRISVLGMNDGAHAPKTLTPSEKGQMTDRQIREFNSKNQEHAREKLNSLSQKKFKQVMLEQFPDGKLPLGCNLTRVQEGLWGI